MFLDSRTINTHGQAVPLAALCLALGVCNACGGIIAEFEVARAGCWRNFYLYSDRKLKDPCRIFDFFKVGRWF